MSGLTCVGPADMRITVAICYRIAGHSPGNPAENMPLKGQPKAPFRLAGTGLFRWALAQGVME
jgi:hypothetical protein